MNLKKEKSKTKNEISIQENNQQEKNENPSNQVSSNLNYNST